MDVRCPEVNEFLFNFMPEDEWDKYERNSQIEIHGHRIDYPIEANIWQMDIETQVEYLKSIAAAGCNTGIKMPERFIEWIRWKLGDRVAEDYMIPYNKKMFGKELNQLGTYWLEKLPNVSFEETLLSCLKKKAYGSKPGHSQFYYPKKFGYGEVWKRMASAVKGHVKYAQTVKGIDFPSRTVTTADNKKYSGNIIITTVPWAGFRELTGMPEEIQTSIMELKSSSVQIEYFSDRLDTNAHWIYYPDLKLPYHRILVRHNFGAGSLGYWTETNSERIGASELDRNFKYMNQYAYPLNTVKKPEVMDRLLIWCAQQNVIGLGRWGEHQHYNSDVIVERALKLADEMIKRR